MPISIIVIIDEYTQHLERVLSRLNFEITYLEFQSYQNRQEVVHRFTPLDDGREINVTDDETDGINEVDTIIVPAYEDGFLETFIGENCWYAVRISAQMIGSIKYIAAYTAHQLNLQYNPTAGRQPITFLTVLL